MMKSKKGISTLIATVLIIGFTVALAAVIMSFGTSFTKGIQKSTSESSTSNVQCAQDVSLSIQSACKISTGPDAGKYKITVANDGPADIIKVNLRLYESGDEVDTDEISGTPLIPKFDLKQITTKALDLDKVIKRVDLIPSIKVSGKEVTCASNIAYIGDVANTEGLENCPS